MTFLSKLQQNVLNVGMSFKYFISLIIYELKNGIVQIYHHCNYSVFRNMCFFFLASLCVYKWDRL